MKTFEFSIIASGLDPSADDFETRFYDAGCDDATVAFQKGHIIVDFARDAESIEEAIASAIENVLAAGAEINRVEPDPLVCLADIASRTGMTRAAMTNYAKGHRAKNFPSPVARVTTDSPFYEWATVARWLYVNHKVGKEYAVEAEAVRQANLAISEHAPANDIGKLIRERVHEYEAAL